MPRFVYKAKKGPHELIDGTIEADNVESAVDKIIKLGYSPVDIFLESVKKTSSAPAVKVSLPVINFNRVSLADINIFTRQAADLVDAGVPLLLVLGTVFNQTANPSLKEIVDKIRQFIQDGGTFSEGLAQYPHLFSALYISMVRSGELSGGLSIVLNRLAEFTEKDQETRTKVQTSLIYPLLMMGVGALTIFVLLTFVIPRLTTMFDDLSQSLPLPTMILIVVSGFFARFWWIVVLAAAATAFFLRKFFSSSEGRLWLDSKKLRLPFLGNFVKDVEIGRFARTLATLLEGGVVIVSALKAALGVLDNEVFKKDVEMMSEEVARGSSLSAVLKKSQHFPEDAINIIAIGEESGRLEQALYKLADAYERQSDRTIKVFTSLLEPILIVVMGSIVGFIVIAMLLPIFKMNLIIK